MSGVWGLSRVGFKPKDFRAIKEELESSLKNEVDPYLHFGPGSVVGVLVGIIANQSRQVWEALSGLYHSLQPDTASGLALDSLCSLTGTYRRRASYSRAKAIVTLDAHTSLPVGSRIKTIAGDFFKTTVQVTNDSSKKAEISGDFIAEQPGPKLAIADSFGEIMTPVVGWSASKIIYTYQIGRYDETDDELRVRRIVELHATGSSTLDAMRSRLLQLDGVEATYIKESEYSFEVIIKGGKDLEIGQTIWVCKPLGIRTQGNIEQEVEDTFKQMRIVRFSRPKLIDLTLQLHLKVSNHLDEAAFKASLIDFAEKYFKLGAEVYPARFFPIILANSNILDVITMQFCERSSGKIVPSEMKDDEIASLNLNDIHLKQIIETAK
jgi:uncharacterized phage protein gp47/JayE